MFLLRLMNPDGVKRTASSAVRSLDTSKFSVELMQCQIYPCVYQLLIVACNQKGQDLFAKSWPFLFLNPVTSTQSL